MRTAALAREHGISTQAVRNYEAIGVLPEAERTAAGYRMFDERHATSLRAFLALAAAHGHARAQDVLRRLHVGDVADALAVLDDAHAALSAERAVVEAVADALDRLIAVTSEAPAGSGERPRDIRSSSGVVPVTPSPRGGAEPISAVAHRLRLRPATLRRWERAGLLRPTRDEVTGHRRYDVADIRDAHLVQQLRRTGLSLTAITPVMEQLRDAADPSTAATALDTRRRALTRRSRSALTGSAHLHALLDLTEPD